MLNRHGDAAFLATASDGSGVITAFDLSAGSTPSERRRVVVRDGDLLPGAPSDSSAQFSCSPVINDSGAVGFEATFISPSLGGGWQGIWAEDQSLTLQPVAVGSTNTVPDEPDAIWVDFSDPVMNTDFHKAFWGRFFTAPSNIEGAVYRADASNAIEVVAREAELAPLVPNTSSQNRHVGTFGLFAAPLLNDTGNVAFLAEVDVTDSTLRTNLDGLAIPPDVIEEEGVFFQDDDGVLRTIAASGMTVNDMLANGDPRVMINLRFSSNAVLQNTPAEGTGSGHQDGRRTGITNTVVKTVGATQVRSARVAFTAVLATPGDPDPGNLDEGVFVADLRLPVGGGGGGGEEECPQCLECILVDCEFNGMLLGLGPDFDQSGLVDDTDLELMMMAMGLTKGRFDMNTDGVVGEKDLAMLLDDYGKTIEKESEAKQ